MAALWMSVPAPVLVRPLPAVMGLPKFTPPTKLSTSSTYSTSDGAAAIPGKIQIDGRSDVTQKRRAAAGHQRAAGFADRRAVHPQRSAVERDRGGVADAVGVHAIRIVDDE